MLEQMIIAHSKSNQYRRPLRVVEIMIIKFICGTSSNSDHGTLFRELTELTAVYGRFGCGLVVGSRITCRHNEETTVKIYSTHTHTKRRSRNENRFWLWCGCCISSRIRHHHSLLVTQTKIQPNAYTHIEYYLIYCAFLLCLRALENPQPFYTLAVGKLSQHSVTIVTD